METAGVLSLPVKCKRRAAKQKAIMDISLEAGYPYREPMSIVTRPNGTQGIAQGLQAAPYFMDPYPQLRRTCFRILLQSGLFAKRVFRFKF
jgi:hypothetical protein